MVIGVFMRGQHRKPLKKSTVTRAATTAGALAATATLALSTPNLATAATAPNHSQVISDFSHALDNFLSGANSANQGGNSIWNPIAEQSGGILPILRSDYKKTDLTNLTDISGLISALKDIVEMDLPWGTTPGALPDIVLPGGQTINVADILPGKLPGVEALTGVLDLLDGLFTYPVPILGVTLGEVIGNLPIPALGNLIKGLEITHSSYESGWDWGALGAGKTDIQNNLIKTPGQLILDLTTIDILNKPLTSALLAQLGLPSLDIPLIGGLLPSINGILGNVPGVDPGNFELPGINLPTATVWVPQGSGQYNLLGFNSGWWAAVPTAALAFPAIPGVSDPFDLTVSVPITSVSAGLPFGLAEAGNMHMTVMMPLDNGLYSPLEFDMTNVNTAFGFGVTNINIKSNNYLGTNGINVNNGQNVLLLQNPLLPIPIVYSLGGFNVGPAGAGIYMPSLFGVALLPDLQLGDKPAVKLGLPGGADDALAALGLDALLNNPLVPTSLLNVTGLLPLIGLPNVNGFIGDAEAALSPFYLNTIGALLSPLSSFATEQYGPFINGTGTNILKASEMFKDIAEKLGGTLSDVQAPTNLLATQDVSSAVDDTTAGRHTVDPSNPDQIPFADIKANLTPETAVTPTAPEPIPDTQAPPVEFPADVVPPVVDQAPATSDAPAAPADLAPVSDLTEPAA